MSELFKAEIHSIQDKTAELMLTQKLSHSSSASVRRE